jgi:hypothetical protein
VLVRSLRAAAGLGPPGPPYRPQARWLSLLDTADQRAIASWGTLAASGRWAMWLKQRIDRGFVQRFRSLSPP